MGRKIPFDQAEKIAKTASVSENASIYTDPCPNKYGYKININHPRILPLYKAYQKHVGERILSDRQRLHFESVVLRMIQKRRNEYVQPCDPDGSSDP